jgi:hypothetical protein
LPSSNSARRTPSQSLPVNPEPREVVHDPAPPHGRCSPHFTITHGISSAQHTSVTRRDPNGLPYFSRPTVVRDGDLFVSVQSARTPMFIARVHTGDRVSRQGPRHAATRKSIANSSDAGGAVLITCRRSALTTCGGAVRDARALRVLVPGVAPLRQTRRTQPPPPHG